MAGVEKICLIETWDVLKSHDNVVIAGDSKSLIETWDVLKCRA